MPVTVVKQNAPRLTVLSAQTRQVDINYGRGAPGPEGKSAYQVALIHGFTGTEQEWIDSLVTQADLDTHVGDTTPHPAYDDLPSLNLLFENGLI